MGPVNMMALEEYKETAERHEFLETQRKDLLRLDREHASPRSRRSISLAAEVRRGVRQDQRKLPGDVHASCLAAGMPSCGLTDEENSAESGIDVVASPPGKKLQNVLLLSGGEKALTALALLVGIFQYRAEPVLHPRRSRRAARRGQHRPLYGTGQRDERADPVRPHHAQQEDHEHRPGTVRRDHAGAGSFEAGVGALRSTGIIAFQP